MRSSRGTVIKSTVDRLEPGAILWDGKLSGFGVRRRQSGHATYFLQYRAGRGRSARLRWITIGRHGSPWTPESARAEAHRLLALVNAPSKPVDPAEKRDVEKAAATITELAAAFEAAHATKWRLTTVATNRRLIARHVVGSFGSRRPNDVTHGDVSRWHVGLAASPGAANRALAMLSSMFGWAIKNGLREAPNPCRDIKHYRGRRIERFLSATEMSRLGEVLKANESQDPYAVAAIRLLIFTGARLGEILSLRWDWVDLEAGLIRLPDSKTGAKAIYLNTPAKEVLSTIPRMRDNPHVVVGLKAGSSLVNLEKPWRRIRRAADLDDVRLHDLRHSFASVGAGIGEGLPIIGKLLGHRNTATTARYAHLSADPIRAANEKIGLRISAALTGPGKTK
ncbi:MAG: site-specific integrase [Alphaproteobacteria bacterium]|nr:site-specific integrase [Alphaproteobacteria bacterium]